MKKRIAVVALATAALLATSVAATAKPARRTKLERDAQGRGLGGLHRESVGQAVREADGVHVQHQYAGSSDEMYNLMKKNAGYDLVSASGDASNRLIASGLVQPIDPSTIPNWKQLTPQLIKGPNHYVDGKYYGLPWQWGPNVLMWNTAKYTGATNSWSALYDPKNKGKITIPNNPIQIADAALYLSKTKPALGIKDPYELNSAQLHAAVVLLKQQRPLIKAYWGFATDEVKIFQTGGATLGAAWPLAVAQLTRAGVKVSQTIPKEGATGWSDVWMMAKNPKNQPCAEAWLKYASGAKVQAEVAKFNTYTPANLQSCKALGNALQAAARRRRHGVPQPHQVLEDAAQRLRQRQERLRALLRMGPGVDVDQGLNDGR